MLGTDLIDPQISRSQNNFLLIGQLFYFILMGERINALQLQGERKKKSCQLILDFNIHLWNNRGWVPPSFLIHNYWKTETSGRGAGVLTLLRMYPGGLKWGGGSRILEKAYLQLGDITPAVHRSSIRQGLDSIAFILDSSLHISTMVLINNPWK